MILRAIPSVIHARMVCGYWRIGPIAVKIRIARQGGVLKTASAALRSMAHVHLIRNVAVTIVALALAVVTDKAAAVSNVAATLVVVILAPVVMIRWIPAAAASVALVIAAARVTPAVEEPPAGFAVTIGIATILRRKSVAVMGMGTSAILIRPAVVTSGAVWKAKVAVTI